MPLFCQLIFSRLFYDFLAATRLAFTYSSASSLLATPHFRLPRFCSFTSASRFQRFYARMPAPAASAAAAPSASPTAHCSPAHAHHRLCSRRRHHFTILQAVQHLLCCTPDVYDAFCRHRAATPPLSPPRRWRRRQPPPPYTPALPLRDYFAPLALLFSRAAAILPPASYARYYSPASIAPFRFHTPAFAAVSTAFRCRFSADSCCQRITLSPHFHAVARLLIALLRFSRHFRTDRRLRAAFCAALLALPDYHYFFAIIVPLS